MIRSLVETFQIAPVALMTAIDEKTYKLYKSHHQLRLANKTSALLIVNAVGSSHFIHARSSKIVELFSILLTSTIQREAFKARRKKKILRERVEKTREVINFCARPVKYLIKQRERARMMSWARPTLTEFSSYRGPAPGQWSFATTHEIAERAWTCGSQMWNSFASSIFLDFLSRFGPRDDFSVFSFWFRLELDVSRPMTN